MAENVVDIRQFASSAFRPLLEEESRAWAGDLRWDYAPSVKIISGCLDEKRLSGYALVRDGRILGYSFFFYEGEKGVIANLFIEPDRGQLDRAFLLLDHVVETLLATPGLRRVETQLPHFTLEELEPCFRPRRFEGFQRHFMVRRLTGEGPAGAATPEAGLPLPAGIELLAWERTHDRTVSHMLYRTYQNHVDAFINDQYASESGAERLVENIVQHRGCGENVPGESFVAFHRPTGKVAAALAVTAVRPQTAHIPQIAVAPEFQAGGLGRALLNHSFQRLAAGGFREISLTVTEANAPALRLYQRLGFETARRFGAFVFDAGRAGANAMW